MKDSFWVPKPRLQIPRSPLFLQASSDESVSIHLCSAHPGTFRKKKDKADPVSDTKEFRQNNCIKQSWNTARGYLIKHQLEQQTTRSHSFWNGDSMGEVGSCRQAEFTDTKTEERHYRPWGWNKKPSSVVQHGRGVDNLVFQLLANLRKRCDFWYVLYRVIYEHFASAELQAPEAKKPASHAGGSSYVFNKPQIALLCTGAMTLTSHHHHWNALEAKGNAQSCQSHCNIDPSPRSGGPGPDSAVVNSLAKLFWHLDQARRHFWFPFFWEPSPRAESHFPPLENRKVYTWCLPSRKVTRLITRVSTGGRRHIVDYQKEHGMWSPKTPVLPQPFTPCSNLAWCLSHFDTSFLIFKVRTLLRPMVDKAVMRCKWHMRNSP